MSAIYRITPTTRLVLRKGDITGFVGDALVTAANQRMLGGGGVDGAIHRAAGPELREACLGVKEVAPGIRCPTGEARVTPGSFGRLQVRAVIHAVGPIYESDQTSAPLLEGCWRSALNIANQYGYKSVAFPAISCGIFGYPVSKAASIGLRICKEVVRAGINEVHIFLFSSDDFTVWKNTADNILDAVE